MKISFELVVKVEGDSLQEIDDALVQAAGERLKARILEAAQPTLKFGDHAPIQQPYVVTCIEKSAP